MVAGDFNGAAWRRQSGRDSLDQSVLLRKPSPTRVYLSRLAAHFYEDQGACQVNGRKCEVSRNRWVPRMNGKSACMEPSLSLLACWASMKQKSCHHEVWIHLLHVDARLVDRVFREDKHCRPTSRKRNSPCDHSKERRPAKGTCHPYDHSWLP